MMFKVILDNSKDVFCCSLICSTFLKSTLVELCVEPDTIDEIDLTIKTNILHDTETQQQTRSKAFMQQKLLVDV